MIVFMHTTKCSQKGVFRTIPASPFSSICGRSRRARIVSLPAYGCAVSSAQDMWPVYAGADVWPYQTFPSADQQCVPALALPFPVWNTAWIHDNVSARTACTRSTRSRTRRIRSDLERAVHLSCVRTSVCGAAGITYVVGACLVVNPAPRVFARQVRQRRERTVAGIRSIHRGGGREPHVLC
jgi:hypothetical protein